MTYKEAKKEAIQVQDACNLSGVVFAFARAMEAICTEQNTQNQGTDWKNKNPIAVLFASKIASLTRCEDNNIFHNAYMELTKESED